MPSPLHQPTSPVTGAAHVGFVVVRSVFPLTDCRLALIVVVFDGATTVARPELLIVAALVLEEDQVTTEVASLVLPSLNFITAVNCWFAPNGIEGFAGLTVIELNDGGVTVNLAVWLMESSDAVITADPGESACTKPVEFSCAIVGAELDQVAYFVMSASWPEAF